MADSRLSAVDEPHDIAHACGNTDGAFAIGTPKGIRGTRWWARGSSD